MRRKKHYRGPVIVGLTGSIGMGKSTVTKQFAMLGAATCDSDGIVHRLLGRRGAAVSAVERLFPEVVGNGAVDRARLGREVFADAEKLKALEAILHPLVREAQERHIRTARRNKKRVVVLDIPLLFETGAEKRCDIVVVATAPPCVQKRRVMQRANMTEAKFSHILAVQMKDGEKRRRADFVVQTGQGKYVSLRMVQRIVAALQRKR